MARTNSDSFNQPLGPHIRGQSAIGTASIFGEAFGTCTELGAPHGVTRKLFITDSKQSVSDPPNSRADKMGLIGTAGFKQRR